jgi:hypothetical protein
LTLFLGGEVAGSSLLRQQQKLAFQGSCGLNQGFEGLLATLVIGERLPVNAQAIPRSKPLQSIFESLQRGFRLPWLQLSMNASTAKAKH